MKKQILLSIAGLTPQVITETLYGIHQEQKNSNRWCWPDEIQVITTSLGKEQILLGLLAKDENNLSILDKLCQDYQRPAPKLSEEHIFVIPDAEGNPVSDARSKEDHEALATFIVRHVAHLCQQPDTRLHASLAGGRKTMTFFLGYALALFAREGDMLSHVLVDELYEGNRHFYYPTPETFAIPSRGDNAHIDASKATVTLAEIPFIRHKNIHTKGSLACLENQSYRDLTDYQNALQNPEDIHLSFNLIQKQINILGKTLDFSNHPLELAFYALVADNQIKGHPKAILCPAEGEEDFWLADQFLQKLEQMAGIAVHDHSRELLEAQRSNFMRGFEKRAQLLTDSDILRRGAGNHSIAETYHDLNAGMNRFFFNDKKNNLKNILLKHFPADIVDYIVPAQVFMKNDWTRRRPYSRSGQQKTPLGLWIETENISLR